MQRLHMILLALVCFIFLACAGAVVERMAKKKPAPPSKAAAPGPKMSVEILSAKIEPHQGKWAVVVSWKNTGTRPIRTLWAKIGDEKVDHPIYAGFNDEPGVLPGETFTPKEGDGFILPSKPAGKVSVKITRIEEKGQ